MNARSSVPGSGFEIVVIGAGVIGLAIAEALSRVGHSVLILEREAQIARGITSRNSEVVHAGLYYPTGSLKAELCVAGRERLYAWCAENRVETRRLGKLIVATDEMELEVLDRLFARGQDNGVRGLERVDEAEVRRLEPELRGRGALHSKETGIVDGQALCLSLLAAAESKGAVLSLGQSVRSLTPQSFGWRLDISRVGGDSEEIDVGCVIDAAGLDADRIAMLAGLDVDELGWRQFWCKGDYFSLVPATKISLERLIYPVPGKAGLGIHATLDLAGRIRFGPDVEYIERVDLPDFDVDAAKAVAFSKSIRRYLPSLRAEELRPDYAGIRPKRAAEGGSFQDFVVEEASSYGAPGFVACIGIESPGLTAALAIADRVGAMISD
jgi:L-2-hydroxyglutarate oxidase LhgO